MGGAGQPTRRLRSRHRSRGRRRQEPGLYDQSIANMLQRFGINVPAAALSSKNVAAVMITADIPAFVKNGTGST